MQRVVVAAGDIKLHHSVFALPFAVLGAFMARAQAEPWSDFAIKAGLVVACMVAARTWAMLVNRVADARLDAANPRTARRAVASGRLSTRDGWLLAALSALAFVACCGGFLALFQNPWPLILSVPVLGWLAFYSFAKRFTALCHILLGSALAISPLAAALAVRPSALGDTLALYALMGMVALWVAGFDIIYALQDVAFDRSAGLHSIPARLGPARAVWLSRAMHAAAVVCLIEVILIDTRLRTVFPVGVGVAAALLVCEHVVLARRGLAGLPLAFFTINGVVSVVLGAAGVVDVIQRS